MQRKILFAASECTPYIKSGGLADVVGSLPVEIKKRGYDVSVIIPLYQKIIEKYSNELKHEITIRLNIAKYDTDVRIFSQEREGVKYFFVENREYFERDELYGCIDDGERFSFFQHAIYRFIIESENYPDIIHSHDWHTGMMAALGNIYYKNEPRINNIKHVFTIHNLAYQGNFAPDMLESCLGISMAYYYDGTLEFGGALSFMKSAIILSDKVNTVSNTYANEILSEHYGERMHELLRYREHDLWGIVNGIDTDEYNPKIDKNIAKKFSVKSIYNKFKNKLALQEELGLEVRKDVCLIGMVSRLTWQKGVSLILDKMSAIMDMDIQLVILGTGDAGYERDLRNCENAYRGKMVYYGGYSERMARNIYSACDLFLMPSVFEPCGISQQISMRYATLPIVRETGGLKDTVDPYNKYEKTGDGFSFREINSDDFFAVLNIAVDLFYNEPKVFRMLQVNAMNRDVSWKKSAELYEQMYEMVLE